MADEPISLFSEGRRTGASDSFIREVWYGQRSLGETYWFWGAFVGSVCIGFGGRFVSTISAEAVKNRFPLFLYFALLIPYSIWHLVGLWRSATNNPSGWATLVKVLIVIGIPINLWAWIVIIIAAPNT